MAIAFAQAGAEQIFLFGRDQKSLADTARLAGEAEHACELFTYSLDLTKDNVNEPFRLMLKVKFQNETLLRLCRQGCCRSLQA